jgi:hydroxyacylglutathione hydrolase
MNNITVIRALGDNFIYLYRYAESKAFVVDPGDAHPVAQAAEQQQLEITHILLTHHHFDHTGGVSELKSKYNCEVIDSPQSPLQLSDVKIEIIPTPGHTKDGVCFCISDKQNKSVFTGDTLFVGGCGRVMGADMATMFESLQKLKALPDETLVYCGHDYTLDNYEFAISVLGPDEKIEKAKAEIEAGVSCVPSSIAKEKQANIFLRTQTAEEFAELRHKKDAWG